MKLHVFDNKETLSEGLAGWICGRVADTLEHQQFFTIALSGGNTPKILYEKLASPEYKDRIDWQRIHVFWGDERVVPFNDDRNNAKMAYDTLLSRVNIPASHIHPMRTDIEPNFAVLEYDQLLHSFFDSTVCSFDLVLLGMGDDGHTLSLFPGSLIIQDRSSWVTAVYHEQQQMYRITVMPHLVNKACHVAFMVDGEKKAGILQKVIEGPYNPAVYPSQLISPENLELHWFLDKAAAEKLHTA